MIPIAKPFLSSEEINAVSEVIASGWVTQGPKVKQFENDFAEYVGASYACAVSNCTAALHLALLVVGVKPGDVVITVSHSFVATANAIRYCGAEPVFVDIDEDTYNISPECLEKCLVEDCELLHDGGLYYKDISRLVAGESPLCSIKYGNSIGRITAIMPVHQMGMPCDLHKVLSIANKYNLPVIEDAACAIGSEININDTWEKVGKPHGDIACFSFHPRKIVTTGDGGMLTTNNSSYDKQFRLMRQHGMSIPDTVRHNAKNIVFEEYVTTAFNYRMTDVQAAIGIEQLKRLPEEVLKRRERGKYYYEKLSEIAWVKAPVEPSYGMTNWQSYPTQVLDDAPTSRDEVMQQLLDAGVSSRRGIMNAHQELPYILSKWNLPLSEKARDCSLLLPLFTSLAQYQQKQIVETLAKIS